MKMIHSKLERTYIIKKVYKIFFSLVLIFILILAIPGSYQSVYAAPLEDCDLDGYDDATGVPVPWPGYDETKGDTPDGPSGSTPTTTPNSSTNNATPGSSKSETPEEIKEEASNKTESVKTEITNNTDSVKDSKDESGKKSSTVDKKPKSSTASNNISSKPNSSVKVETDQTSSAAKDNTSSAVKDNSSKEETSNTIDTSKVECCPEDTSAGVNYSVVNANILGSTTPNDTNGEPKDGTNGLEVNDNYNQDEYTQIENEQTKENISTTVNESEDEIKGKYWLEISEKEGSIIHAGSSIIVSGSGFEKNIDNLEIEIQPAFIPIGIVETSENGLFEASFNIPEDLKAGVYNITVLYQGEELTHQEIVVGPKAADSFLQALLVGFTKDNRGLVPGLVILLGLFILGISALGANELIRIRQSKSKKA